jgi:hypothetical protein
MGRLKRWNVWGRDIHWSRESCCLSQFLTCWSYRFALLIRDMCFNESPKSLCDLSNNKKWNLLKLVVDANKMNKFYKFVSDIISSPLNSQKEFAALSVNLHRKDKMFRAYLRMKTNPKKGLTCWLTSCNFHLKIKLIYRYIRKR